MRYPNDERSYPSYHCPAEIRSIIIGLVAAMLLSALDQTIVATAMPTIGIELGDAANLPWIVTAYLLASTAVTPLYGKLSDIHGRRIMLLIAITTFSLGSLLCALAPTMIALALARGLQGIGGSTPACQTARNVDPGSASKIDPLDGCVVTPLISPVERVGVAQPG